MAKRFGAGLTTECLKPRVGDGHPDMKIVLVAPEIPGNTGTIGRTCVALDMELILIRPYGFELSDKTVRRAGLDYWKHVRLRNTPIGRRSLPIARRHARTCSCSRTTAAGTVYDPDYPPGAYLVFGRETTGLPPDIDDGACRIGSFACRCSARISARSTSPTRQPRWPIRRCGDGCAADCRARRNEPFPHRRFTAAQARSRSDLGQGRVPTVQFMAHFWGGDVRIMIDFSLPIRRWHNETALFCLFRR
jgi:tRNA (cytidine/uridine-2'-O-)-methyltransferase